MSAKLQSLAFDFSYSTSAAREGHEAKGNKDVALDSLLYQITTSLSWFRYEKGLLKQDECYQVLAKQLEKSRSEVQQVIETIPRFSFLEDLRDLQTKFPDLNIFPLGNGTLEQVEFLESQLSQAQTPKVQILSSCHLGERLPHPGFMNKAINVTQLEPSLTLFVSYIPEHVAAAQTAGLQALLCLNQTEYVSIAQKVCSNPVERGMGFLKSHAGHLDLHTSAGKTLKDSMAQFLILEALKDKNLVYLPQGLFPLNYLHDDATNKVAVYSKPACVEINAIGLSNLSHITRDQRDEIMDMVLAHRDSQGIVQVYLSDELIRLDLGASVAALALFNEFGRGDELQETEDWIFNTLKTRAHEYSSHYYTTPDLILFFVSRLLEKAPRLRAKFKPELRGCVLERKAAVTDSISLAARLIAAARCGIRDQTGVRTLIMDQNDDGSWPAGAIYKSPQSGQLCYHQGLTTAWAIQAIKDQSELELSKSDSRPQGMIEKSYDHTVSEPRSGFQLLISTLRKLVPFLQ